jgi:hypothetical protein
VIVTVVDGEVVEVLDVAVDEVVIESMAAATVSSETSAAPTLVSTNTALPAEQTTATTARILNDEGDTGGVRVKVRRT